MKSKIEILHVSVIAGRSKKTGNDYDMRMAQCIIHKPNRETGVIEPLVGELVLPERYKDIPRGVYDVEFEVSISQDKRVGSAVFSIEPHKASSAPVAPSPVAQKAA